MGLKKSIERGLANLITKAFNPARAILPFQNNVPQYIPDNFKDLAIGGYGQNEVVYSCIKIRANALAESPLRVVDKEKNKLENHPLRQLISKPNPFMTEVQLWLISSLYYDISGNVFWEKVRSASGRVIEIWPLRPDRVRIVLDEQKYISGYTYDVGGNRYDIPKEDIIHFKNPDPLNDYFGMAPLRAGIRAVSIDNEANDFTKVLLQNFAIPPVMFIMEHDIDEKVAERWLTKFKEKFGKGKRGEPGFFGGIKDVKTLGLNLQDLALPDLRSISETRICTLYGVPPILINLRSGLERSTFANYGEARVAFQEDTMGPYRHIYSDVIDRELRPEFDTTEGNVVEFDTAEIAALKSARNSRFESVNQSVTAGWLTVNDARREVGLNPITGQDVFLRGLTVTAVPAEQPGKSPAGKSLPCGCSHKHKLEKKEFELLRLILGRFQVADKFAAKVEEFTAKLFADQAKDVLQIYAREAKALDKYAGDTIVFEIRKKGREWKKTTFNSSLPVLKALTEECAKLAAAEMGISFTIESEQALNFVRSYTYKFADGLTNTSVDDIKTVIEGALRDGLSIAETRINLLEKFSEWEKTRAAMVARTEVIRGANMGAKMAYKEAGIKTLVWVAAVDHCDSCAELDGTTVGIDDNFADLGDKIGVIDISYDVLEVPPLHPNCRCAIVARN